MKIYQIFLQIQNGLKDSFKPRNIFKYFNFQGRQLGQKIKELVYKHLYFTISKVLFPTVIYYFSIDKQILGSFLNSTFLGFLYPFFEKILILSYYLYLIMIYLISIVKTG